MKQKKFALDRVSKKWLDDIRGSTRLSSEMYLNIEFRMNSEILSIEDINAVLSRWPNLKTLYVSNLDYISRHGINLKAQQTIKVGNSRSLTK